MTDDTPPPRDAEPAPTPSAGARRRRPAALATRRRVIAALTVLPLLRVTGAAGQPQDADPAAARIRAFYDVLQETMRQADRLGIGGRYDKLSPAIRATFDLPAMTRIAVGPAWTTLPAAEQSALLARFARMTIATYANRFDGYSGETFVVEPTVDVRATGRIVRTRLVPAKGEPIVLNYSMRGAGADWRVVDVYLSGTISELATRRAEFGAILAAGGAPALIRTLDAQAEQLLGTAAAARPATP